MPYVYVGSSEIWEDNKFILEIDKCICKFVLGKPSNEKNGNSLVLYQRGGGGYPLSEVWYISVFFTGFFCQDLKLGFLEKQNICGLGNLMRYGGGGS